jgi:hypothetical protein
MLMERRGQKKEPTACRMLDCWQDVVTAGFCGACYSWWGRTSRKTASELGDYMLRLRRFSGRARFMGQVSQENMARAAQIGKVVQRVDQQIHRIEERKHQHVAA